MSYEAVAWEVAEGVGVLTFNRPDALNAINVALTRETQDVLRQVERDRQVRCLVITGAGRAFCAGADLRERAGQVQRQTKVNFGDGLRERYNPIILRIRALEKPVIAAVNGVAAGAGCSIALACDLRIASDRASLLQAFVRIGLVPDCGATYFLPRLVGLAKALELAMSGDQIPADEALRLGLVNRVVPHDDFDAAWREMARQYAAKPTRAIGLMKRAFNRALTSNLESALDYEASMQGIAGATADASEGRNAFLERRAPIFRGE